MAKLKIRITNQPLDNFAFRKVEGRCGREYIFMGEKDSQSYLYEPKVDPEVDLNGTPQFEIRDIFELMTVPNFPWRFEPVMVEGEQGDQRVTPARIAPYVTPDKYASHTLEELLALAADCGFAPKQRHDPEAVRAQLAAYFVGRAVGEKAVRSLGSDATDAATSPAPPKPQRRVPPAKIQGVLEV